MPDFSYLLVFILVPAALGYLLGSIPFGVLITRAAGLGDIRKVGSGNIGATNVLRTGHKGLAALTLLGDMLKGTAAVLVAGIGLGPDSGIVAGLAAFLGHLFPVWLGFKGGKGVATYIGVVLGMAWQAALVFCAIWLAVAALSRLSSLSALVASIAAPVALFFSAGWHEAIAGAVMTGFVLWKHLGNIERLRAGTEPRIGQGSKG